jgi:hypothetical protein
MRCSPIHFMTRRGLLGGIAALQAVSGVSRPASAQAQTGPLASWNDGPAKQAILDFVRATTDHTNPGFVPPEERIATFDQDGTLWIEHPMYSQLVYCLEQVPAVVGKKPELAAVEPFKIVLSGDRATRFTHLETSRIHERFPNSSEGYRFGLSLILRSSRGP